MDGGTVFMLIFGVVIMTIIAFLFGLYIGRLEGQLTATERHPPETIVG